MSDTEKLVYYQGFSFFPNRDSNLILFALIDLVRFWEQYTAKKIIIEMDIDGNIEVSFPDRNSTPLCMCRKNCFLRFGISPEQEFNSLSILDWKHLALFIITYDLCHGTRWASAFIVNIPLKDRMRYRKSKSTVPQPKHPKITINVEEVNL